MHLSGLATVIKQSDHLNVMVYTMRMVLRFSLSGFVSFTWNSSKHVVTSGSESHKS